MKRRAQVTKPDSFDPAGSSLQVGFTLVEVLVTVAIAGVLAVLLFSAMGQVRESAKSVQCTGRLKNLMVAVETYRGDFNRYPQSYGGNKAWWDNLMTGGYVNSAKDITCPSGGYMGTYDPNQQSSTRRSYGGYGYTSLYLWPDATRTDAVPAFFTTRLIRRSMWPLIADGDYLAIYSLDDPTASAAPGNRFAARHGGWANVLMADGHIERARYGDKRWRQSELNNGSYFQ